MVVARVRSRRSGRVVTAEDDLAKFCEAMLPRLRGVLWVRLGDAAVAEELAQEAMMRVCANWAQVSSMAAPEQWAYRVAFNLANSWFRRRFAQRRAYRRVDRPTVAPSDVGAELGERDAVRAAVRGLPSRQREVVALRFFEDLSVDDAAAVMGCAPGTVKSLTNRAVATLRTTMPAYRAEENRP